MKKVFLAVCLVVCGSLWVSAQKKKKHDFEISKNLEIFNDIYKKLDVFYVDTLSADTVIRWGIDAMLQRVDPFTVYYSKDDMGDFRTMTTGKYAGIGSYIRYHKKEQRVVLTEPYENSPAQKTGIRGGDVILSVDGTDVKGLSVDKVSNMLRGDAGTVVEVQVKRYNVKKPITYKIKRQNIQLPQVPYYGEVCPGVGYIYLTGFTEGAYREVRHALLQLKEKGVQSLIFDLRGNPGGALNEAVDIAGLFIPKGSKVVSTKGKMSSTNRTYYTTHLPVDMTMPMVVLVDGGSASSSEIVAGALQDYDRAVILGQRTYGKGLVQMVRDVPYGGNLKLTTSRYYIPSGRCIQAYDYRHLKEDGSVGTLPDSLTNVFKTKAGREVRDGGGIKPDVKVVPDSLPSMIYDLASGEVFIDFANRYVYEHKTIASAGDFELTDAEYETFVDLVKESGFTYNRRSVELLNVLKKVATREGYYEDAKVEFEALSSKFSVDISKDMHRFKKEISTLLCNEIVRRYYYQRGGVEHQLKDDQDVKEALKVLSNKEEYNDLLSVKE